MGVSQKWPKSGKIAKIGQKWPFLVILAKTVKMVFLGSLFYVAWELWSRTVILDPIFDHFWPILTTFPEECEQYRYFALFRHPSKPGIPGNPFGPFQRDTLLRVFWPFQRVFAQGAGQRGLPKWVKKGHFGIPGIPGTRDARFKYSLMGKYAEIRHCQCRTRVRQCRIWPYLP